MERKMYMELEPLRFFCLELAEEIRNTVRPHLGSSEARFMAGRGRSGDSTFSIDEWAEKVVECRLEEAEELAYFSEDRGLVRRGEERWIMVVDPIDGTRPAAAGLEACCVSIAVAPLENRDPSSLTLGDVIYGLIREIKNDALFEAVKGGGAEYRVEGIPKEMRPVPHEDLSTLFWTIGFRGRPALPLVMALEELIDISSVDGGIFDLGSATYCITRLLTGQMDAYVDIGDRMLRDLPELEEHFRRIGHGHVLNNSSYDLAAVHLLAKETGLAISDAYGRDLKGYPLLASGREGQLSCIAAVSEVLLRRLVEMVDRGMDRLRSCYRSRDARWTENGTAKQF